MKILIFSDIHGDRKALERLMATEADYYFCAGDLVNMSRSLDSAADLLSPHRGRFGIIPGNHESETAVSAFCEKFGFENWHGKTGTLGGKRIAALGYSNITPFDTPGEYSEEELARRLDSFTPFEPEILICHCPPKDTELDRAGKNAHFGSTAVRQYIDKTNPKRFFCGHIHECEGVETTLGLNLVTIGRNVGKRGYLLDLEKF